MITFRREYLDRFLESNTSLMKGNVLDIGGVRENKRGRFRPPLDQVNKWEYLNSADKSLPDYLGDADKIPVSDASFNTVIMTEVLEYCEHHQAVFIEMARVLELGGIALVTVPFLSPIHGDREFDRYRFTKVTLQNLSTSAKLEVMEIKEMGSLGAVLFDFLEALTGYANPMQDKIIWKVSRKLLYFFAPLFGFVDRIFVPQSSYIHTGYSLVLKKVN